MKVAKNDTTILEILDSVGGIFWRGIKFPTTMLPPAKTRNRINIVDS